MSVAAGAVAAAVVAQPVNAGHDAYAPRNACSHVALFAEADAGHVNVASFCTYRATAAGGYVVTARPGALWRVEIERHGKRIVYSSATGSRTCHASSIRIGDLVKIDGDVSGYGGPGVAGC